MRKGIIKPQTPFDHFMTKNNFNQDSLKTFIKKAIFNFILKGIEDAAK
jgi:hypothetical protein